MVSDDIYDDAYCHRGNVFIPLWYWFHECALCTVRACVSGETVTLELGDRSIYTSLKLCSPLPVCYKHNCFVFECTSNCFCIIFIIILQNK